ncbi:MAG: hypothetical protein ACPGO5_03575 [Patescibacteria group bacterium]
MSQPKENSPPPQPKKNLPIKIRSLVERLRVLLERKKTESQTPEDSQN